MNEAYVRLFAILLVILSGCIAGSIMFLAGKILALLDILQHGTASITISETNDDLWSQDEVEDAVVDVGMEALRRTMKKDGVPMDAQTTEDALYATGKTLATIFQEKWGLDSNDALLTSEE